MNPKDFGELIESIREAGRILRGEAEASRQFRFTAEDVQEISGERSEVSRCPRTNR